jgi:hypothetical protein
LSLYGLCGVVEADNAAPEQALHLLRLIAKAQQESKILNQLDVQMVLAPLQLDGWDPAALPAELQPYAVHFRAALALW